MLVGGEYLKRSICVCVCCCLLLCDRMDSMDRMDQAPPSKGFSRQEYWSGLLSPIPGDLPDPGTEPQSPASSVLSGGFSTTKLPHQSLNKCEATSADGESGRSVSSPREASPTDHTSQFRTSVLITAPCGFPSSQTSWKYVLMDFISKRCHPLCIRAGLVLALLFVPCNHEVDAQWTIITVIFTIK